LTLKRKIATCFILLLCCGAIIAAEGQANGPQLEVRTTTLPKAYVRKSYETRVEAQGGITPFKWELAEGSLPAGVTLSRDGIISGIPAATGEFDFTVTVRDSATPPYERQRKLSLLVVAPLLAEWGRYPKVVGQRIEGSILVSNQTENDFDLTAVMLAVNETGRATAIGYQHFPLTKGSTAVEIPFGENLPDGAYQLNVDVVAEIAETDTIHRARLVPKEQFQIQTQP
jgi:Putative Ig domain